MWCARHRVGNFTKSIELRRSGQSGASEILEKGEEKTAPSLGTEFGVALDEYVKDVKTITA